MTAGRGGGQGESQRARRKAINLNGQISGPSRMGVRKAPSKPQGIRHLHSIFPSSIHPFIRSVCACCEPGTVPGPGDGVATGASRLREPTIQRRGRVYRRGHRKWQVYDLESSC